MNIRHTLLHLLFSLTLIILSSCSSSEMLPTKGNVHHVVLCWLKEPGNSAARQKLIEATYRLKEIPGVIQVSAGTAVPSDRSVVDDSFDVGLVIVLKEKDVLQSYLNHPIHKAAIAEVLTPLTERIIIYDYEQQ